VAGYAYSKLDELQSEGRPRSGCPNCPLSLRTWVSLPSRPCTKTVEVQGSWVGRVGVVFRSLLPDPSAPDENRPILAPS
jgi:hypothetical protein